MRSIDTENYVNSQSAFELNSRVELLKMFMDHTPAAVAMCDLQMRYLAYNRRWARDYGLGKAYLYVCNVEVRRGKVGYALFKQDARGLRHRLRNQGTWKNRVTRKMPVKIRLVCGYVFIRCY